MPKGAGGKAVPAREPLAGRVVSVDALRGFDMFWIVGGKPAFLALLVLVFGPLPEWFTHQFTHEEWEGFTFWDLIMPLFLFISGVSMPFSFAKSFGSGVTKGRMYAKVIRRVLILWVLGMACQGNLLDYDIERLRLYSNTLQAIASGYLVSAVLLMHLSVRGQVIALPALLIAYWLLMTFVPVPGHGPGVLTPEGNLAMYVDETLLGKFRDGTHYTWILSSITFAASVLMGVLGGHVLLTERAPKAKASHLLYMGLGCLALGWAWSYAFPIIKHIWTSSMVLWAGGWCYLLLAGFYLVIDVGGFKKWAFPLVVIGANAIAVYVATELYQFRNISDLFIGKIAPSWGAFSEFLTAFGAFLVPWLILLYMYRKKTFLRV